MPDETRAVEPEQCGTPVVELVAAAQAAVNAAVRQAMDDAARGDFRALRALLRIAAESLPIYP